MVNDSLIEADNDNQKDVPKYPLYGLESSIGLAESLRDLGAAKAEVDRAALAAHMGVPPDAQTLGQRISAAKSFGLLDGRGTYSLSDLARRYFFPTTDTEKNSSLVDMLANPPAFAEIIRRFDGDKLPSVEILANIIHRQAGVPESWRARVAGFFIRGALFAGVIDPEGFLRWRVHRTTSRPASDAPGKIRPVEVEAMDSFRARGKGHERERGLVPQSPMEPETHDKPNLWDYSFKGAWIRLETPKVIPKPLWEKLNQYVQLLKPSEDEDR